VVKCETADARANSSRAPSVNDMHGLSRDIAIVIIAAVMNYRLTSRDNNLTLMHFRFRSRAATPRDVSFGDRHRGI